jgi:hypothetical protein
LDWARLIYNRDGTSLSLLKQRARGPRDRLADNAKRDDLLIFFSYSLRARRKIIHTTASFLPIDHASRKKYLGHRAKLFIMVSLRVSHSILYPRGAALDC